MYNSIESLPYKYGATPSKVKIVNNENAYEDHFTDVGKKRLR